MKKTGFTIIELVISIFIITVAVVGVYSAFSLAVILSSDAANRLTAAYLGQEGQEIERNIRKLKVNDDGFYVYDGSFPETKFKRKITVTELNNNPTFAVLVKVEVSWDEKSNLLYLKQSAGECNTKYNCVEAEATLYDWYPSPTLPPTPPPAP